MLHDSDFDDIRLHPVSCWPRGSLLTQAPVLSSSVLKKTLRLPSFLWRVTRERQKIPTTTNVWCTIKPPLLFLSLYRFSTPMLTPPRWSSIGSHSQSWPASCESDPRRGRTALRCGSSSTAVRLRVRKMERLLLWSFSDFFWPIVPRGTLVKTRKWSCQNLYQWYTGFYPGSEGGSTQKITPLENIPWKRTGKCERVFFLSSFI